MDIELTSGPCFLIVDDDEIFACRLSRALSARGYETETAASLDAAYERLARRRFDVLVTDLRIAGGNGLELVKTVQEQLPQPKILVLTGYGSVSVAVAAVKLGATDVLTKPVDVDEILEVLGCTKGESDTANAIFASPELMRYRHIVSVYEATGKNISKTARQLNMHRRTLQRLLGRGQPKA